MEAGSDPVLSIQGLIEELECECFIRGVQVSKAAVQMVVRRRLALGQEDMPGLLRLSLAELCTEDPSSRALVTLQAHYSENSDGLAQEVTRRRYLKPLEKAICELAPASHRDLLHLTDLIVTYAILSTGLGNPSSQINVLHTKEALESFLSPSDLDRFCAGRDPEKLKMLDEISHIAGGIRLFNRNRGKADLQDFEDYPGLLSEYLQESQRLFVLHLEECRAWLGPVHRLMAGRLRSVQSPRYQEAVRVLLLKLQVLAYIKMMFLKINELAVDFEKLIVVFAGILEEIYVQTEHRYAVPSKTIHPLFIQLSVTYMKFFKGIAALSNYEQLLYTVLQHFHFEDSVDDLLELLGGEAPCEEDPEDEKCVEEEFIDGFLQKINPALIKSKECRLVFADKNHFDKLEYNGFDPVCPVLAGGLLLEAQPQIGMLLFQEALIGFSSCETAYIFAEDPQKCHKNLIEFIQLNPHYLEILQLNDPLECFRKEESEEMQRKNDVEVQTVTHP